MARRGCGVRVLPPGRAQSGPRRLGSGLVVFLPGAAGTVQEIFDNATPNYYQSRGEPTPMVLVNRVHWTEKLPTWPLLQALAADRPMATRIALVDSVDEVPDALVRLRGGASS